MENTQTNAPKQIADLKDAHERLKFAERELLKYHRLYVLESERRAKVTEALTIVLEELNREEK